MLHNCPVMAVPSGFAPSKVPTGIQLVGRTLDDARVFRVALAYEKASGDGSGKEDAGPGSPRRPKIPPAR